ncbi:hypothetical protein MLD38_001404 [Melastoma candidum]|uniref:Uncharacterized protein n=1 Tax=Melastoma candidum TaxID=119954 RepID=A0ACB9SI30_9MYRT|nr:hypothetical protein MLD38_001404 [Melastoma candidum]
MARREELAGRRTATGGRPGRGGQRLLDARGDWVAGVEELRGSAVAIAVGGLRGRPVAAGSKAAQRTWRRRYARLSWLRWNELLQLLDHRCALQKAAVAGCWLLLKLLLLVAAGAAVAATGRCRKLLLLLLVAAALERSRAKVADKGCRLAVAGGTSMVAGLLLIVTVAPGLFVGSHRRPAFVVAPEILTVCVLDVDADVMFVLLLQLGLEDVIAHATGHSMFRKLKLAFELTIADAALTPGPQRIGYHCG